MKEKCKKSLSYIISIYNEEKIVRKQIEYCIECLEQDFEDFEIILIDDGSKDNTGQEIDKLAKDYDCIIPMKNIINLNLGIAIQRGMVMASKEYLVPNAIDLPLDPKNTRKLLEIMGDIDILVLERKKYLGTTGWRRFTSIINRLFIHILFPVVKNGIYDTNFIQIYRKNIISQILPLARSPIFVWPEMIFRARYAGLKVRAVKTEYNPNVVRKGAFGKPNDIIWGVYDMLRFRIRKWHGTI